MNNLLTDKHLRILFLISILAVAFFIRLLAFHGISGGDDFSIALNAIDIVDNGLKTPQSHYGLRIGLTLPLAGVFSIFGIGEWQIALLTIAFSLLGIYLAYEIGCHVGGIKTGIAAAFLLAIFPLDVSYGTNIYPDMPMGVALALSYYFAIKAINSKRLTCWLIFSGLTWSYAYFIKIEAVFMGLVFIAMALYNREFWKQILFIIIIFAIVVLGENIVYLINTGEFFYRIHIIRETSTKMSQEFGMGQLWIFPKAWFITFYQFGLYYYFLFTALIWAILKQRKALYLLLIWVFVYLIWLEFGGNPFASTYRPKSHLLRYCAMINVPVSIIIGYFIGKAKIFQKQNIRIIAIFLLVLPALFFINFNTLNSERQQATKLGIQYAVKNNCFPLYMDRSSYAIAKFLLWNKAEKNKIFSLQDHNFKTGETKLVSIDNVKGYIMINKEFMRYHFKRYFTKQVDMDFLKSNYTLIHSVNNPGGKMAYFQVKTLIFISSFIPVDFIKEKISGTSKAILESEDVLIFKSQTATDLSGDTFSHFGSVKIPQSNKS